MGAHGLRGVPRAEAMALPRQQSAEVTANFVRSIRAYLLRALLTVLPSEPNMIAERPVSFGAGLFVFSEVIHIQIRQVNPAYLAFLRSVDPHVPVKEERPWLWPVMIDGMEYGIPCTTRETVSGYIGYMRSGTVHASGLYLRYMVPVPSKALLPAKPLSPELRSELTYYELNRQYIQAEALLLHRLSCQGQMDRAFQSHSCDFKKIEQVYTQWQPGFQAGHFLYPKEDEIDMPISKRGNPYYTKGQYEAAMYSSSALVYAQSQGYDLVRQNGWYKLREHDSMVFTPDGRWFWNSRGLSGGAIEFMMYYENRTLVDAVLTLANDPAYTQGRPAQQEQGRQPVRPMAAPVVSRVPFALPEKAEDFRHLFGYLCGKRGLEKSVVQEMIYQNRLYQSCTKLSDGREIYNATFVYQNGQGKPVGAYQRGMMDRPGHSPYKRDVPGSVKSFGWMLSSPFHPAVEVRVFEAAIDAASDASLDAMRPGSNWKDKPVDRLSLEGLSYQPLQNYLRTHSEVRTVALMLDRDGPGRRGAERLAGMLRSEFPGVAINNHVPPNGKDWNDVLTAAREAAQPAAQQEPPARAAEPELEAEP